MITAIAFDGNGVLYYRKKDFTYALMEYIKERHCPDFDIEARAADQLRFMHQSFDGRIGKAEAMSRFLDAAGIPDPEVRADITEKEIAYSKAISLFPTEKESLLELDRRGFVLGMITNSYQSAAEKASWFRALGLGCIADRVVSSIDSGFSKPDKGIYLDFARRAGAKPEEIAFIGHEEHELRGAEEAGMLAISFNCEPGIRRKIHLGVFSDLLDLFPRPGCTPPRR
jgi:FMN phosphatase YigB (HAD superfamily)